MKSQDLKKFKLPDSPGVYFFKNGKNILYIGKATSLQDRVKSYFNKDIINSRSPLISKMVDEAKSVSFIKTDSVIEALILEANNIKKFQPKYNTKEKDNKSFNYIIVTKEDFPRILIIRGRELLSSEIEYKKIFGPYPNSTSLKEALVIIRKIFPFRDKCIPKVELKNPTKSRPCFNAQIGLCPGVCMGLISKTDYNKIVRHIILFFEGKKSQIIKSLEKDMKNLAKEYKFEDAGKIKKTIFALNHIQDIAIMKREKNYFKNNFRIEAYDIAHISGTNTVGVMVVVENGEKKVSDYRKFRIKGIEGKVSIDDNLNLKEVLIRRLTHLEWPLPKLIVVDGSTAQYNTTIKVLKEKGFNIEIVGVVKDEHHKPKNFIGKKSTIEKLKYDILLANSEAHRFGITYHRNLRSNVFKKNKHI